MNREGKRRSGNVPTPYKFVPALRQEHSRTFVFLKAMQALCHLFNGIEVVLNSYADSVPHCAVSPPIIITHHTTKRIHNEQQSQIRNATEQHIAVEKFSYRLPKTTSFYTKISLLTGSFGNVLALGPGFDPPLA